MNRTELLNKIPAAGIRLSQKETRAARAMLRSSMKTEGTTKDLHAALLSRFAHKMNQPWQSERVVRTEGTRIKAMKFKSNALRTGKKRFVSVHHADSPCAECVAMGGSHNLGTGDKLPPYHPNCRCHVI